MDFSEEKDGTTPVPAPKDSSPQRSPYTKRKTVMLNHSDLDHKYDKNIDDTDSEEGNGSIKSKFASSTEDDSFLLSSVLVPWVTSHWWRTFFSSRYSWTVDTSFPRYARA